MIKGGLQAARRITLLATLQNGVDHDDEPDDHQNGDGGGDHLEIQFREQEHHMVERRLGHVAQRRGFAEFFRGLQFIVERGEDLRHVELEAPGVILHRAADVNGRGEAAEVAAFERGDMVRADLGHVGDLLQSKFLRLARGAELFGYRWHSLHLARLTRTWQSWKITLWLTLGKPGSGEPL